MFHWRMFIVCDLLSSLTARDHITEDDTVSSKVDMALPYLHSIQTVFMFST